MRIGSFIVVLGVTLATPALAACTDDDANKRRASTTSTTASVSITMPIASSLGVVLELDGEYDGKVVHVVRVERPDGKLVLEKILGPDRTLSAPLDPGEYRVLSYQRPCKGECATDLTSPKLGQPTDICGAKFSITGTAATRATVKLTPHEGCAITLA